MSRSASIVIPRHLHKYVIGTKGTIIKGIQDQSGSNTRVNIMSDSDTITVTSESDDGLSRALQMIRKIHDEHKHLVNTSSTTLSTQLFTVPGALHKYLIGTGGKVVQTISQQNSCQVDFLTPQNQIKISCSSEPTAPKIQNAYQAFVQVLKAHNWHFEGGRFVEKLSYENVYHTSQTKVEEQAVLMQDCFEKAKKAFECGRKQEAKLLSDKGYKHQALMNKYKKEASQQVFKQVNNGLGVNTLDLHGQQVEEAIELLTERLKQVKGGTLTVITGAGNHARSGAKIKPQVIRLLEQKRLKYKDVNNGTLEVVLQ